MPSSILNSDDGVISGTSGLKSTGGDDGVLVFQSKGTETARINTDKQIVAAAGTASLPVLTTTGDVNTGIYFPAADNIGFATGGTIRGRWTTDGLCFGSDTAAANALDDYEEGTFTPTFTASTTNPTVTYTGSNTIGAYTKIGNLVFLTVRLEVASVAGGSGTLVISGLPFTPLFNNQFPASSLGFKTSWVTTGPDFGRFSSGTPQIELFADSNTGETALNPANLQAGTACIFSGCYQV